MQDGIGGSPPTEPPLKKARREGSPQYWCHYCEQYLFGPVQVEDHIQGKKHARRKSSSQTILLHNGICAVREMGR